MKKTIILVLALLCLQAASPAVAAVGGWEHFQAQQLGRHNGDCAAEQSKRDFILKDYSNNDINPQGLRMKAQVISRNNDNGAWEVTRETEWVTNTNVSPAVCYNPNTESTRVVVEAADSSPYLSFYGAGWWGETAASRDVERGRYQRGVAHLKAKGEPTTDLVAPAEVFLRTGTPTFIVRTNDAPLLYNASSMARTFIGFWQNNRRTARFTQEHGGLLGVRQFIPGTFPDGLYTWTVVQQLNGVANVEQMLNTFDRSCGATVERVDYALREQGGIRSINPRDVSASIIVRNSRTQAIVSETAFATSSTVSPSVCYDQATQSIGLKLQIAANAYYFNGGTETVRQSTQVTANAQGKLYFRIIAELPARTRQVTEPINMQFTPIGNINTLKDLYAQRWKWVPGTGISETKQFYIDRTLPTLTATLQAATSTAGSQAIAIVNARDIGSGLRQINMVFTPMSGQGSVATVTIPFAVGTGIIGGPKDTQVATWRTNLRPGTSYRYVATAVDVAGNTISTTARTFTAPTLTPDIAFQNFFIRSTCTPESVNFVVDATCPQTTVAMAIRNTSNGVINRGVNIPYRVEYRYPGNDTGTWTEVYRGNYAGGLEAQTASPVFNVIVNRAMRGTGQLRALVNMAPQTNNAIGETEFGNNTSPTRAIVFATTPPTLTLTTDRGTVRSGQTVTLTYNIESPQPFTCELRGNGTPTVIRHEGGDTTGTIVTTPITSTQKFTLSCVSDMGGDPTEQTITIEVIPFIDEV